MTNLHARAACPCCGYQTIDTRGNYDICKVCWWEDDGQDNVDANIIQGGSNYKISLLRGRFNFLKFGIYDPDRKDLMQNRDDANNYPQLRKFILETDQKTISEVGSDWRAHLDEEQDPHDVL